MVRKATSHLIVIHKPLQSAFRVNLLVIEEQLICCIHFCGMIKVHNTVLFPQDNASMHESSKYTF